MSDDKPKTALDSLSSLGIHIYANDGAFFPTGRQWVQTDAHTIVCTTAFFEKLKTHPQVKW